MSEPFATFGAFYQRIGTIDVMRGICHVCGKEAVILAIDSSTTPAIIRGEDPLTEEIFYGSEYGPGCICRPCIDKAFTEGKS